MPVVISKDWHTTEEPPQTIYNVGDYVMLYRFTPGKIIGLEPTFRRRSLLKVELINKETIDVNASDITRKMTKDEEENYELEKTSSSFGI